MVEYTFVIEGTKNPQSVTGLSVIKQTAELELIEMQSSLQLQAKFKDAGMAMLINRLSS